MKFKYKKLGTRLIRPIIPITIRYKNEEVRYEVLVDSGADINLMNAEIAELLGIDVKTGKPGTVTGVTGEPETFYMHKCEIVLGGHVTTAEISFAEKVGQEGYGILGQRGFFDLYKFKFDYKKADIEIVPQR